MEEIISFSTIFVELQFFVPRNEQIVGSPEGTKYIVGMDFNPSFAIKTQSCQFRRKEKSH